MWPSNAFWPSTATATAIWLHIAVAIEIAVVDGTLSRKIRVGGRRCAKKCHRLIEEKLLEIKRSISIRRGLYLFQIRTGVFFQ